MKKIILGACLLLGTVLVANATETTITITTSCGGVHEITCSTCSVQDFVDIAMAIDAVTCYPY